MNYSLLIILLALNVNAISFYAQEGKEKCFTDEIPGRSIVVVYHELKQTLPSAEKVKEGDINASQRQQTEGLEFRVYDPTDKLVMTKDVKLGPNKLSLTSDQNGRYRFCVFKTKSFWKQGEYKYSMKIQQGVDFQLEDAANKTHVMDLQERIDILNNRTQDFLGLLNLNREQEDKLYEQSVTINERVIVLGASGIYQIWSLRRFFKQRFLL